MNAALRTEEVHFGGRVRLAGTVSWPDAPGPAPGLVMIGGSGPSDRVALRLCAGEATPRHLILNSCPATSFLEAELYALGAALGDTESAQAARGLLRALARCARSGAGYEQAQRIVARARGEPWYPDVAQAGFALDRATWEQLIAWGDYDPRDDLRALRTPTLAVLGAEDPLVPVEASVASLTSTAERSPREQRIAVFPEAGHRLQRVSGDSLAPGYLDTLREWARGHARPL